eukprot:scaffold32281_cov50-Cyclotella_meneghiniana.AAC.5
MSMLSRGGRPRKRKPSDSDSFGPTPKPCECYKCGLTFLSHLQMTGHVLKCKETNNKNSNNSTITYTQGELQNAVQLYNQPSMSDMVVDWQLWNEANKE